jgi:YfiH family protein
MTITASSLSALSGIRHAFFARDGGVSSGIYKSLNAGIASKDDAGHVVENRARMARALGVAPENFLTAYQIHSPDVVVAEKPWDALARPKADAVVTRVPGLAVGVSTADCGPVLFADEKARVVGAAHAGWRGAFSGVVESTLDAMEGLGARRANIVTALGPMIRQPNYEVSAEFYAAFVGATKDNERYFRNGVRPDHYLFDLAGYIAARLRAAGVGAIEDCGLCTYAEPDRFYSYRRSQHRGEGDYGRHVNAIVLSH